MRLNSLISSVSSLVTVRSGLLLGCALALSACNTTGDAQKKTALISPQTQQNNGQTVANTGAATNPTVATAAGVPVATQTGQVAQTNGQLPAQANALVATQTAQTAQAINANTDNAGNLPLQTQNLPGVAAVDGTNAAGAAAAMPDPVLPVNVPVPGIRGQSQPVTAFASARQEASPASLAANMQFETPASAPQNLDGLISKYSVAYDIPERLVRRVVHRESRFNPGARNGPYWGLMQISHATARGMGYQGGANGLLDAETNLKYAVKYLAGAYRVADGNESQAVRYYARGYYYDAKRKGKLNELNPKMGPTRAAAASIKPVAVSASVPAGKNAPLPGVAPTPAFAPAQ